MQQLQQLVQDIADKDASQDAALLKSVLGQLPFAALIVHPPERTMSWCNPAVETLLGYPPDELIGQCTRLLHVDAAHFAAFYAQTQPVVASGRPYRGRFWLRHRQGHLVATDHLIVPLDRIGGRPAVVSFVQSLYGQGDRTIREGMAQFTQRERQVFELTCRGLSAKRAAQELGISHRTVEIHRDRVLQKLGHASIAEMMAALLQAKGAFSL